MDLHSYKFKINMILRELIKIPNITADQMIEHPRILTLLAEVGEDPEIEDVDQVEDYIASEVAYCMEENKNLFNHL